jgi:acetylglutamate kinase
MALSGSANKQLVSNLSAAGAPAAGISGEDGNLLLAILAEQGSLGRVGLPVSVDTRLPRALLAAGFLPVISPLGHDSDHAVLNVNGDDAAAALAAALCADELLMFADVPGVLVEGSVVRMLDPDAAQSLIYAGVADGGMAAKLEAAVRALAAGVRQVRIGDHSMITNNSSGSAIAPAGSLV